MKESVALVLKSNKQKNKSTYLNLSSRLVIVSFKQDNWVLQKLATKATELVYNFT